MKVVMSWRAFSRMRAYVNASYPKGGEGSWKGTLREISGWGTVDQLPNGDLYVDDVLLMPQEATFAHIELSMDGWAALVGELAEQGRSDDLARLHMWWHSHPFGSAPHFSSIDTGTMEKFQLQDGYLLSIVTSEKGQMEARYDQWDPVRQRLMLDVEVEYPALDDADVQAIRDEVVEKVTFTSDSWSKGGWGKGGSAGVGVLDERKYSVWRMDVPEPYLIDDFDWLMDARKRMDELKRSLPANTYEVFEGDKKPENAKKEFGSNLDDFALSEEEAAEWAREEAEWSKHKDKWEKDRLTDDPWLKH